MVIIKEYNFFFFEGKRFCYKFEIFFWYLFIYLYYLNKVRFERNSVIFFIGGIGKKYLEKELKGYLFDSRWYIVF